jgi:hypothetical protein
MLNFIAYIVAQCRVVNFFIRYYFNYFRISLNYVVDLSIIWTYAWVSFIISDLVRMVFWPSARSINELRHCTYVHTTTWTQRRLRINTLLLAWVHVWLVWSIALYTYWCLGTCLDAEATLAGAKAAAVATVASAIPTVSSSISSCKCNRCSLSL